MSLKIYIRLIPICLNNLKKKQVKEEVKEEEKSEVSLWWYNFRIRNTPYTFDRNFQCEKCKRLFSAFDMELLATQANSTLKEDSSNREEVKANAS